MPEPIDYASPNRRQSHGLLRWCAYCLAAYPLFLLASLYGQWSLSSIMLGHLPRPSLDDPKYISVANWMHPVTMIAILGFVPASFVALLVNALYLAVNRFEARVHFVLHIVAAMSLWIAPLVILYWDPLKVMDWWMD